MKNLFVYLFITTILAFALSACKTNPGIPVLQAPELKGESVQSVCLEVEQSYPQFQWEYPQAPIANAAQRILTGMGLQVLAVGETCDATLRIALTGRFSDSGDVEPSVSIDGQIHLLMANGRSYELPINVRGVGSYETTKLFMRLWPEALLNGLTHLWGDQILVQAIKDENVNVRLTSIFFLEKIGPEDWVIDELVQALGDENAEVWSAASWAIGDIPPAEKVSILLQALENDDWRVRKGAAQALEQLGPEKAADAVPSLIHSLNKDENTNVRLAVAAALRRMKTADAIPAFSRALNDEDERIRQISAQALTEIGSEAADAVSALIPGLEDEDKAVRWAVAQALAAIGPAAESAVPSLTTALDDEYWRVRQAAAEALQSIGPGAETAVPALIQTTENALIDYHFRLFAAASGALVNIGNKSVPALIQVLEEGNVNGRQAAAGVLGAIGPEAADAMPVLTQALTDEDGWVRLAAFYALSHISPVEKFEFSTPLELENERLDPETSADIITFIQTTEGSDWMSIRAAVEKLGGIGPGNGLVSTHIQNLESEDISTRQRAAQALNRFGPDAAKAVPALIRAYDDEKSYVRSPVIVALGKIGSETREAIPILVQALWDRDSQISWHAGQSLGKIGAEEGVVPGLAQALAEGEFNTRSAAADGLALIGPDAIDAVPVLIQALQDDEKWIRDRSLLALKSITGEDFGKNAAAWQEWWETQS